MAPASWWGVGAAGSAWDSLSEHDPVQATPFLQYDKHSRVGGSFLELNGGNFQRRQHRSSMPRMAASFEDKKEGAAAEEEKEGKGDPPDSVLADDMAPANHGRTLSGNSCRCLPNSIQPPRAAWLLRNAAKQIKRSAAVHRQMYHTRLDEVESGTEDQLKALYKIEKQRDYAFEDLHQAHLRTEAAAADFKAAFAQMKDAYSEGDCLRVHEKAEEFNEEIPKCHEDFQHAAKEVEEVRALVSPGCNSGAVKLTALQPPHAQPVDEEVKEAATLPPDVLCALPTPATFADPRRSTASRKIQRDSQRHRLSSFL